MSSIAALVHGPSAPKQFESGAYFRDCWIRAKFPKEAFGAAIALQVLLVAFPPPIWSVRPAHPIAPAPRTELAWYGPIRDFPVIVPPTRIAKAVARKEVSAKAQHGADAFHPRQTILSEPLHPTHPRQTLIQPKAPQEPPKILPALPNIVQLRAAQPERPKLDLTAREIYSLRPKASPSLAAGKMDAPEVLALNERPGTIDLAPSADTPKKPALPVNPMSVPHAARKETQPASDAPEVAVRAPGNETIIALSATPAPVTPPPAMPSGNLAARVSISPDGSRPGKPNGDVASAGTGRGPEGIFIGGPNGTGKSAEAGLALGSVLRGMGSALPARSAVRPRSDDSDAPKSSVDDAGAMRSSKLDAATEKLLGDKRIYTLHVNMPNLTSASGSWVLNFAEMNEAESETRAQTGEPGLSGPVPVRKIDPKYPPELRSSHVDGEVVLYAIIRKDGSVDSIQLVRGIDPNLDANAMEALAQWKFMPAQRSGQPVDLEAVVHIPFRSRPSAF